jgi:hypothetical protein
VITLRQLNHSVFGVLDDAKLEAFHVGKLSKLTRLLLKSYSLPRGTRKHFLLENLRKVT